jgi:hypothetical protein
MAHFLITLPDHDDATDYCSKWSKDILKTAEDSNHKIKKLEGPDANRKEFVARITLHKPHFIMLNGHGNKNEVKGYANEIILSSHKSLHNEALTKGQIAYIRACGCGAELGPACIAAGCRAFIGYKNDFAMIRSKSKVSKPLEDERAKPFFEVSNQIPINILKGNTIAEAIKKADMRLEKEIDRLMSDDKFIAIHLIPWLLWNKNVRVVLGEETSIIQG